MTTNDTTTRIEAAIKSYGDNGLYPYRIVRKSSPAARKTSEGVQFHKSDEVAFSDAQRKFREYNPTTVVISATRMTAIEWAAYYAGVDVEQAAAQIEVEAPAVEPEQEQSKPMNEPIEYKYSSFNRPVMDAYPPFGFVRIEQNPEHPFGVLVYGTKLVQAAMNQYELYPVTDNAYAYPVGAMVWYEGIDKCRITEYVGRGRYNMVLVDDESLGHEYVHPKSMSAYTDLTPAFETINADTVIDELEDEPADLCPRCGFPVSYYSMVRFVECTNRDCGWNSNSGERPVKQVKEQSMSTEPQQKVLVDGSRTAVIIGDAFGGTGFTVRFEDGSTKAVWSEDFVPFRTVAEIEELKRGWMNDPCYDIETAYGFEAHYDELLAYRLDMKAKWELAKDAQLSELAAKLNCSNQVAAYIQRLELRIAVLEQAMIEVEDKR